MTEVEKLRALLAEAVPLNTPCPSCLRTIEEERQGYGRDGCVHTKRRLLVDAALAEPGVDDYKRGAEAMRETAIVAAMGDMDISDAIRALPVPEDKP